MNDHRPWCLEKCGVGTSRGVDRFHSNQPIIAHPSSKEESPRDPATTDLSDVDLYRLQIMEWLDRGLAMATMLNLVRVDPVQPYTGTRPQFGQIVRCVRRER